jgi:cytochrome P450
MATADVHISGHRIPKDAIVFGFLTTSHLDPTNFPEPYHFRPDRFLDDVTATVQYKDRFIPFSVGGYLR